MVPRTFRFRIRYHGQLVYRYRVSKICIQVPFTSDRCIRVGNWVRVQAGQFSSSSSGCRVPEVFEAHKRSGTSTDGKIRVHVSQDLYLWDLSTCQRHACELKVLGTLSLRDSEQITEAMQVPMPLVSHTVRTVPRGLLVQSQISLAVSLVGSAPLCAMASSRRNFGGNLRVRRDNLRALHQLLAYYCTYVLWLTPLTC